MKVYITGKDFKITIKESGKKDIVLNANIEVFNYLTELDKIMLGALDLLNRNNDNYFNNAVAYLSCYGYMPNVKYSVDSYELSLNNNINLENPSLENLPSIEEVKKTSEKLKKMASLSPITIYEIKTINEVPLVCILHFSQYGYVVKKCKNCKKWFIPKTTKETKFCYRNDEVLKTMKCDLAYKYKERLKRIRNDEAYKIHKQIYNNLRNSCLRTKDISKQKESEKVFGDFKIKNREQMKLLQQKKITEKDYISWLKSFNKGGGKNGKSRVKRNT